MRTLRLRDFCNVHQPRRSKPVDGMLRSARFVTGADLFREVLTTQEIEERSVSDTLSETARLRIGDILVPVITRRPCARLVGAGLVGCYAHHSVAIIRPQPGSVSLQRLAAFLSSAKFLAAIEPHVSTLAGAIRLTVQALTDVVFEAPSQEESPVASVTLLMNRLARDIIRAIAARPSELQAVEWRVLERVIAEALNGLGFDAELTPSSKDGGKDIVLTCFERGLRQCYVVEIKHWVSGKLVGGGHLKKFLEVVASGQHDRGLFLSTSGFVRDARNSVAHLEHSRLRIAGAEKIVNLCEMYVQGESGLWVTDRSATDLLFTATE